MPSHDLSKIRNIGIIAHIDAGKTTTTEHVLYYAGAKHRLGEVDAGTTDTDYDPEEQDRGITIYSACIPFSWRGLTVNLIDTPGHVDFTAEVERSLRVLDGCVVVFDAQKGVEAQSETVWRQADRYQVPRVVFVNKMDVVGANFANVLEEIRERLEGRPVALTIPIGSGSPRDSATPFTAVIDLIGMKALYFEGESGKNVRAADIPAECRAEAQRYREQLFDVLTERDDQDLLTSAYLEGRDITAEAVRTAVRELTLRRAIQPVFCGSGREHVGVQPLIDAVTYYLPSPLDRPPVVGQNPKTGREETRKPDPKEPFCGLVFKIVSEPHGELFYVRVYSGVLKSQSRPYNPGKDRKEMVSKLYHVLADPSHRDEVAEAYTGDIVAVVGMRESVTGDTLCDFQHPLLLEPIRFAEAVVSRSVEPQSAADKDKLVTTLNALKREDPTFDWRVDRETGQTLVSGMGMLHLEIKQNRMERDFRLKVRVGKPNVSYRETIRREAKVEGVFERQIASTLVHARVGLAVKPEPGLKIDYAVPKEGFAAETVSSLEQGIRGALESGWLGFPVVNLHVLVRELADDRVAPPAVNQTAVSAAAADAVHNALKDNVVLLEPVMRLEVTVPEEYLGPVTADLNARRAEITEVHTRGKLRVIEALVPLAKTFDYSEKVRSLSQGRADWTMEPHAYAPAPDEVLQALFGPGD
jgi:elongation factor G